MSIKNMRGNPTAKRNEGSKSTAIVSNPWGVSNACPHFFVVQVSGLNTRFFGFLDYSTP